MYINLVKKIFMVLIWISGILFFWTSIGSTVVFGFESLYYAWVVVVLTLMSISLKGINQ